MEDQVTKEESRSWIEDSTHPHLTCALAIAGGTAKQPYLYSHRDRVDPKPGLFVEVFNGFDHFADVCDTSMRCMERIKFYATDRDMYQLILTRSLSLTDLQLWTWRLMCHVAVDRMAMIPSAESAGRRASNDGRMYMRGSHDHHEVMLPRQARTCAQILQELWDNGNGDGIPESRLRTVIHESRGRLNTKQDPWRIFQYYRGRLLDADVLEMS